MVDAFGWSETVLPLGVAAILAWFLYYATSKLIPQLHKEHTEATERICKMFSDSLKDERDAHRTEVAAMREKFRCMADRH
jgi:hypothetical protein